VARSGAQGGDDEGFLSMEMGPTRERHIYMHSFLFEHDTFAMPRLEHHGCSQGVEPISKLSLCVCVCVSVRLCVCVCVGENLYNLAFAVVS